MSRINIFLLIILLLVIATILVIRYSKSVSEGEEKIGRFSVDLKRVNKITLRSANGPEILFEEKNGFWYLQNKRCNQKKIETFLEIFEHFKPLHLVSDKKENLSTFVFFPEKQLEVSLFHNDKLIRTYLIGKEEQGIGGTYVRIKDEREIYLINKLLFTFFTKPVASYF